MSAVVESNFVLREIYLSFETPQLQIDECSELGILLNSKAVLDTVSTNLGQDWEKDVQSHLLRLHSLGRDQQFQWKACIFVPIILCNNGVNNVNISKSKISE